MANQLFDQNGRRIVPDGLTVNVSESYANYRQAPYNRLWIFSRLASLPAAMSGFNFLSDKEFVAQIAALVKLIEEDERLSNVLNGPCYPIRLPMIRFEDEGTFLNKKLLPLLAAIYEDRFPGRSFDNYCKDDEPGLVTVAHPSYQLLLDAIGSESRAAIMSFPLQGYPVIGQREQMESLPQNTCNISLAGPVDMVLTAATHVEEILKDGSTLGCECSATHHKSRQSLILRADDEGAVFGSRGFLNFAAGTNSSGLLFW
jgi:hypothetical protein